MNEEILSGLKNAKERGFSLEESAQTFINAGYDASEVREAQALLAKGFTPLPAKKKEEEKPEEAKKDVKPKTPMSARTKWIIGLTVAIIVLGSSLALMVFTTQTLALIDLIFP